MPRGVYDRSKSKEQRAAEKGQPAKAPAKKGGRPKKVEAAAPVASAPKAKKGGRPKALKSLGGGKGGGAKVSAPVSNEMFEIRMNLQALSALPASSEVSAEIQANVELLAAKRREVVGLTRAETEAEAAAGAADEVEEEPAAPVAAAPAMPYGNNIPLPPNPLPLQVPNAS
jgi:hypothetical protein